MLARRWILVALVCGCVNPHDSSLVRIDQEVPGANCQYGGVAVSTGIDANDSGTLDDDEIESTQFVCNGAQAIRCDANSSVHTGAMLVHSENDFAQLAGVNCIDGDLIVSGIEGEIPMLVDLQTVTGEVVIAGNDALTSLDGFVALRDVGQSYLVQGNASLENIATVANLDHVLSLFLLGNDSLPDLAGLASLNNLNYTITVANNPALQSLHGLENVLSAKYWIYVRGNSSLVDISALGNLRSVGAMEVSSNASLPSLSLPNLERADVRLVVNQNPAMTSISLPRLVTLADGLYFNGNTQLTSIDAPELLTTAAISIENSPVLGSISMPQLSYIAGDMKFTTLTASPSTNFSSLKAIGGMLSLNYTAISLTGFNALDSVGSLKLVQSPLADFSGFSALHTIAGTMTLWECPNISSFNGLDAMTTIGGDFTLYHNASLSTATINAFVNSIAIGGNVSVQ